MEIRENGRYDTPKRSFSYLVTKYNHPVLEPEHLLLALLTQQDGIIPPLVDKLGAGKDLLISAAALVLKTVKDQKQTVVVVDCDCDGYTSSAILINYLHDLFPSYV